MDTFEPYIGVLKSLLKDTKDVHVSDEVRTKLEDLVTYMLGISLDEPIKSKIKCIVHAIDKIKNIAVLMERPSWMGKVIKKVKTKGTIKELSRMLSDLQCAITILQIIVFSTPIYCTNATRAVALWVDEEPEERQGDIQLLKDRGVEVPQLKSMKELLDYIQRHSDMVKDPNVDLKIVTTFQCDEDESPTSELISSIEASNLNCPILIYTKDREQAFYLTQSFQRTMCTHRETIVAMFAESFEVKSSQEHKEPLTKRSSRSKSNLSKESTKTVKTEISTVNSVEEPEKSSPVKKSKSKLLVFDEDTSTKTRELTKSFGDDLLDSIMLSRNIKIEVQHPVDDVPSYSTEKFGNESMIIEERPSVLPSQSSCKFFGSLENSEEGELQTFYVKLDDTSSEEKPVAIISGPILLEAFFIRESQDSYIGRFFPTKSGTYTIVVMKDNKIVSGTPLTFVVKPNLLNHDVLKKVKKRRSTFERPSLKRSKKSEYLLFHDDDDEDESFIVEHEGKAQDQQTDSLQLFDDEDEHEDKILNEFLEPTQRVDKIDSTPATLLLDTAKTQVFEDDETVKTQVIEEDTAKTQVVEDTIETQVIDEGTLKTQVIKDTLKTQNINDTAETQIVGDDIQKTLVIEETAATQIIEN